MERVGEFPMAGEHYRQTETVFLVSVEQEFEPVPVYLEEIERSMIDEFRWLSAAELRALADPFYPEALADLLDEIVANGPPDKPWTEGV